MKAFVLEDYSQPPKIMNIPIPKPATSEVLVKVAYCGVNRVDLAVLSGRFGDSIPSPLIMGAEIVGTLPNGQKVAVNPYLHCNKCKYCLKKEYLVCEKGRPLLGVQKNGGYAEYVTVPKDNIIPIPEEVSLEEAASVTLSAGTAYRMVFNKAKVKDGQTIIVTAAGSGVGIYSCQFAKIAGGKVIALVGNASKIKKLKDLGIIYIVNYSKANWEQSVSEITKEKYADILIDTVGGATLEKLILFLGASGKIVLCGATEKPIISLDLVDLYMKQKQIIGSSGFMNEDLAKIFQFIKTKRIKSVIDSIYSLSEISKAWEKLKQRKVFGKILIRTFS